MLQVETRLVAPLEAAQAEIRFIQPAPGTLLLDDVSLTPTLETLHNGKFQQWKDESGGKLPVGWTRLGGLLGPTYDDDRLILGMKLQGNGPEDAVLAQTIVVGAGEGYELQVCARADALADDPETLSDQERARLELRWLAAGSAIGAAVILPLDGRGFPTHAWAGVAPEGATQAEIRLIQPQGEINLQVASVSLSQVDLVSVPLIFLAQAPGELTVSNLRVAYEPPGSPPELPVFPDVSDESDGDDKSPRLMSAPRIPAIERMAERAIVTPFHSPLADRSIGIVAGVGDRFLGIFNGLPAPITSITELAALDSRTEISGITRDRQITLKAAAEMVMALNLRVAPFAVLADESLETLLALSPDELAQRASQRRQLAEQLQRDLRALRLLLKNDAFRSLHLSDLLR